MSSRVRDGITGAVLLAVASVWIILVYTTIEPLEGTGVGARAFPLFFGLVLAALALMVLLQAFLSSSGAAEAPDDEATAPNETTSLLATIGALFVYGALLEPLGFVFSTIVVVAAVMAVVLRIRSPLLIAGMSLGLSLGCYLVFGKLLGTYLPPGTLYPIYF